MTIKNNCQHFDLIMIHSRDHVIIAVIVLLPTLHDDHEYCYCLYSMYTILLLKLILIILLQFSNDNYYKMCYRIMFLVLAVYTIYLPTNTHINNDYNVCILYINYKYYCILFFKFRECTTYI